MLCGGEAGGATAASVQHGGAWGGEGYSSRQAEQCCAAGLLLMVRLRPTAGTLLLQLQQPVWCGYVPHLTPDVYLLS